MTRSYKKLWHILLDRDMSRSDLRKKAGISTNALARLGKDESLPLETLEKITGRGAWDISGKEKRG